MGWLQLALAAGGGSVASARQGYGWGQQQQQQQPRPVPPFCIQSSTPRMSQWHGGHSACGAPPPAAAAPHCCCQQCRSCCCGTCYSSCCLRWLHARRPAFRAAPGTQPARHSACPAATAARSHSQHLTQGRGAAPAAVDHTRRNPCLVPCLVNPGTTTTLTQNILTLAGGTTNLAAAAAGAGNILGRPAALAAPLKAPLPTQWLGFQCDPRSASFSSLLPAAGYALLQAVAPFQLPLCSSSSSSARPPLPPPRCCCCGRCGLMGRAPPMAKCRLALLGSGRCPFSCKHNTRASSGVAAGKECVSK